jgi:hypothetical protein
MKSTFYAGVAAAALLVGFAAPSHASLMLEVTDGSTTHTITDFGNTGEAIFFGSLPGFSFSLDTGLSKPMIGSADQPVLDLNLDEVASRGGGGTLTFKLTDTGFDGDGGPIRFLDSVGGTFFGGGSLSVSTFMDCDNDADGDSTPLTSATFSGSSFSGGQTANVTACHHNYSLTELATLTLPGGAQFSGDANLAVPEPPAIALFGAGLLGLCFALRRKERPGSMTTAA